MGALVDRLRSPDAHPAVLTLIVALMMAPVVVRTTADPDLWGHVRYGLDMIETRTLPSEDPYSFTQDIAWVNHEWLSELTMAIAYRVAGSAGLVAFKTVFLTALVAIVWRSYRGVGLPVRVAAILLLLWGGGSIVGTLRPQLWTWLGVAVLCRLFLQRPARWWLTAVPVIFVLWVNAHGGWVVGAGLLAIWTGGQLLWPQRTRAFALGVAALSAAATLINPYGTEMWSFLGTTVRFSRDITEWQPLFVFPVTDWLAWVVTMAIVGWAAAAAPRPPLVHLAMIAMLAYSSVRVIRIAPLCITAAIILLQPAIANRTTALRLTFTPLTTAAARGLLAAIAAMAVVSSMLVARAGACLPFDGDWVPDRMAGRALAESSVRGRLVTWFDWGQYALWHLSPGVRISMDGRRETIYSAQRLDDHFALYEATPEGLAFFAALDPDYVWLPSRMTKLRDWLSENGFRIDFASAESFVASRRGRSPVLTAGPPLGGCFPGP